MKVAVKMMTVQVNKKETYTVKASQVDTEKMTWTNITGTCSIIKCWDAPDTFEFAPTAAQLERIADPSNDATFDAKTGQLMFSAR